MLGLSVSRLRLRFARSSLLQLLSYWILVYLFLGLLFGIVYAIIGTVSDGRGNFVRGFWNALYFSFTTQSTVGYGDYVPVGSGRFISVVESVVGMAMNALLLGIAAVKVLKSPSPIIFPEYVVYELQAHKFWFRFMNVDPDQLREVTLCLIVSRSRGDNERAKPSAYDTQANYVMLPFSTWQTCPTDVNMALRTVSNDGQGDPAFREDGETTKASPALFFRDAQNLDHPDVKLTLTIKGYFETTGDQFFGSKVYDLSSVRCGQFEDVDNRQLQALSSSEKVKELSKTTPSSSQDCAGCPYHRDCVFEVARETRKNRSA